MAKKWSDYSKKDKRNIYIGLGLITFFIIMVIAIAGKEEKIEYSVIKKHDVLNGSKDRVIGQRCDIFFGMENYTDGQLYSLYHGRIKNSGCMWWSIFLGNGKGYQFAGSQSLFTYGIIDKEGVVAYPEKQGNITDDSVTYYEVEK